MATLCVICGNALLCKRTVFVKRGLDSLIAASNERQDGKVSLFQNKTSIELHVDCRKDYIRYTSIAAFKRKRDAEEAALSNSPSPTKTRMRATSYFNFKECCFFCGDEAVVDKEKKKRKEFRKKIKMVSTLEFKNNLMNMIQTRNDDWAKVVRQRIIYEIDLVAADARYHDTCLVKFSTKASEAPAGRPLEQGVVDAMGMIYSFIETNDDCQFTLSELKDVVDDLNWKPDDKTIKKKLAERYGDRLVITSKEKGPTILCFRDTNYDMLSKAWYENRGSDPEKERFRIVQKAAEIIRQDIRSAVCEVDTYPASTKLFSDVNASVPKSLLFLIEEIVIKNRKGTSEPLKKKSTAICHAIMSAVRPRSFISPLLLGVTVHFHRYFGSRRLIDILSSLGFCTSYKEALLYESSNVLHHQPSISPPEEGCFIQYVGDNADHNVATIDGLNTFHSMGIIRIVAPHDKVNDSLQTVPRLKVVPTASELTKNTQIPIKLYENCGEQGLKKIIVEKLVCNPTTVSSLCNSDVLWMYAKYKKLQQIPGWSGFMELLTEHEEYCKSRVMYLPFINHPSSNYDTIYSTLLYVLEDGLKYGHKSCVITFDQPLFIKAREIVASADKNSRVSKIIVRLGGFHMCMSFLGSIGFIMAGSGLKEIMSTIYASHSVDKILAGHAYSRAIRAHTLLQIALSKIIFNELPLTSDEQKFMDDYLKEVHKATFSEVEELKILSDVKSKFQNKCSDLKDRGPTSKLWVQYLDMVLILKEFIRAERMGDWRTYMTAIKKMLPYFHAAGHFLYAKSAHLFVQDMEKLEFSMVKDTFKKFTSDFFTIKRSDKFFCGTSSDMVIEQSLMKSSKIQGGFVHGRSTKESVLTKFVVGLLSASNVTEGLEKFCEVSFVSGEQHVDARESRVKRDQEDVNKISEWFCAHNPFPSVQFIMCIATGVTGDVEKINCYDALNVGVTMMRKKVGDNFQDIKYSRSDRVRSLQIVKSHVTVHDVVTPIDPLMLFQRISVMKRSDDELRECFKFELAPYPVALFDEIGMRKTTKSSLFHSFNSVDIIPDFGSSKHVIDGGYLLHRVVWRQNDSFGLICDKYVKYVEKHYGQRTVIVFDSYSNPEKSIKTMEQLRRCSKAASMEMLFDENMIATVSQEKFLANAKNKSRLICLLTEKFKAVNICVKQAKDDADVLIVETALMIAKTNKNATVIVGEDVDLLVIMVARTPPNLEIFFLKPGKGKVELKIYSSTSLERKYKEHILFLHAFSGCDGTSAIFGKGKSAAMKLIEKRPDLQDAVQTFNQSNVSHTVIIENGIKLFLAIYGASSKQKSLDDYRFSLFTEYVTKNKAVNLSTLPPTSSAAHQHLFRVYYQVQTWLGNELNPQEWGWIMKGNLLFPVRSTHPPAPDSILNMIFCSCSKGCGSRCGCRKLGLHCSLACGNCHGQSCLNVAPTEGTSESEVIVGTEEIEVVDEMDL